MTCIKCSYKDKNEKKRFDKVLCSVCFQFAPLDKNQFDKYILEKIDWKILDIFRRFPLNIAPQKQSMQEKAKSGKHMTRPPLGYNIIDGKLIPNQQASKLHSLFKVFLEKDYSLNSLAKNYGLSVNGLKKILTNRTYLGEIKFAGSLSKGNHEKLISPEIFYAVQRKLKGVLRT